VNVVLIELVRFDVKVLRDVLAEEALVEIGENAGFFIL
jgi:hypothetical protein